MSAWTPRCAANPPPSASQSNYTNAAAEMMETAYGALSPAQLCTQRCNRCLRFEVGRGMIGIDDLNEKQNLAQKRMQPGPWFVAKDWLTRQFVCRE